MKKIILTSAAVISVNASALTTSIDDISGSVTVSALIKAKATPEYTCTIKEAPIFEFGEINPKDVVFLESKLNIECDTDGVLVKFSFEQMPDRLGADFVSSEKYSARAGITKSSQALAGVKSMTDTGNEIGYSGYEINGVKTSLIGASYAHVESDYVPYYYEGVYDTSKGMVMDVVAQFTAKDFKFEGDEAVNLTIPLTITTSLEY